MRKPFLIISILFILLLSACARKPAITPLVQPVGPGGPGLGSALFTKAECPSQGFRIPNSECGFLTVPEDRGLPDGKTIRLPVMIIRGAASQAGAATAAPKPDPVLLLTGGGGPRYMRGFISFIGDALAGRDLIMMDQRGSGSSEPVLDCPELNAALNEGFDRPMFSPEKVQQAGDALTACRLRWTSAGIALQGYSSEASAADIEDLRLALGYPQWNLFATGGSSHLAYLVMRDYPAGVRSAVIDSPLPEDPALMVQQAANTQAALSSLFDLCGQDKACGETYPDIEARFYHVVDDLNISPLLIEVQNLSSGQRANLHVDGEVLLQLVIYAVTNWDERVLPEIPRLVAQLENGQTGVLKTLLGMSQAGMALPVSPLTWFSNCTEILPLVSEDAVAAGLSGVYPALASYYQKLYDAQVNICPAFDGLRAEPARMEPVRAGTPTLAVFTSVSPATSLAWVQSSTANLDKAWIIEFKSPTGGSAAGVRSCAGGLLQAFLDDPLSAPDAACASQAPTLRWITFQQ